MSFEIERKIDLMGLANNLSLQISPKPFTASCGCSASPAGNTKREMLASLSGETKIAQALSRAAEESANMFLNPTVEHRRAVSSTVQGSLAGLGDFPSSVTEAAERIFRSILPLLPMPPVPTNALLAIYMLAKTEKAFEEIRRELRVLRRNGMMRPEDSRAFETRRKELYALRKSFWTPIANAITSIPGGSTILSRVPRPDFPPGLDDPDTFPLPWVPTEEELSALITGNYSALSNLNARVVRVRNLIGASPGSVNGLGIAIIDDIGWSGLLLIAVATLGIVTAIVYGASLLAEAMANYQIAIGYRESLENRRRIYEECVARGTSPSECTRIAGSAAPTPQEAGANTRSGGFSNTLLLGAVIAGAAWFFLRKSQSVTASSLGAKTLLRQQLRRARST